MIREILSPMIETKRNPCYGRGDLLTALLLATERREHPLLASQAIDQVITLLGAATETAASVLTWTFVLLSQNPIVEKKLATELAKVTEGRPPTLEDIGRHEYLRNVILEAMRLYPPGWLISRTALNDHEIGGYYIPAKSTILVSPYVTHRSPQWWPNPDAFDPDRFEDSDAAVQRPAYAYFPFGGGPRKCVGEEFAMIELPLVVATIVQRYRTQLVEGGTVEPYVSFTLRPRDEVRVSLVDRSDQVPSLQ